MTVYAFRDFVWFGARRRDTGALAERGLWSDLGTIDAQVIDRSGVVQTRTYVGGGHLVSISSIPRTTGVTAQSCDIELSVTSDVIDQLVRDWDLRRAPVEIHRGRLNPESMLMEEPAVRRFVGFVDQADIPTPEDGREGYITLTCSNHVQELRRSNSAKRSDADQQRRHSGDRFYEHGAVVGSWKVKWHDGDWT